MWMGAMSSIWSICWGINKQCSQTRTTRTATTTFHQRKRAKRLSTAQMAIKRVCVPTSTPPKVGVEGGGVTIQDPGSRIQDYLPGHSSNDKLSEWLHDGDAKGAHFLTSGHPYIHTHTHSHGQLAMLQLLPPEAAVRLPRPLRHHGEKQMEKPRRKTHFERLSAVCLKLPSHPVCWGLVGWCAKDEGRRMACQLFLWLVFIHGLSSWCSPSGPVILSAPAFWPLFRLHSCLRP